MKSLMTSTMVVAGLLWPVLWAKAADDPAEKKATRVAVAFSGGHETDPRDRGRPVVLVAAGLGVSPEVFRDAFKDVRPAPAGARPSRRQEQRNKSVLLKALGKHGVTNDRLDEVSDRYRYNPGRGELWLTRPAVAFALVREGKVVGYEVVDGGSGYSSPPTVTVPDVKDAPARVDLTFGEDLERNGSIAAIAIPEPRKD
ncbi:hypothetical protein [Paludisphaera mucosa]|uniref:Uncharacterized protein n=1 Tax=Paludisphaera mucosa TaxID=3030827 RepID=A0ABT6FJP7_9BACT|nr:hypothetical protein [Paludisphaera mucosa]MDG3007801.1 hypothetical protein [Paludisphaera mucosa]